MCIKYWHYRFLKRFFIELRNKKSRKISKCYFFWKKKKTWIEKNLEWIDYRRSSSLKVNKVINVNLCALNVSKSSDPVRLCESIDRHLSKKINISLHWIWKTIKDQFGGFGMWFVVFYLACWPSPYRPKALIIIKLKIDFQVIKLCELNAATQKVVQLLF